MPISRDLAATAGRIGGLVTASRHAGAAMSAPARAAFLSQFEAEVDPEGVLDPFERQRRAAAARQAHMARLTLASIKARRAKARKPRREWFEQAEASADQTEPAAAA